MITIEKLKEFKGTDLNDLIEATKATFQDQNGFSIGFNRSESLSVEQMEAYWRGVLLVPERELIVGRYEGTIAGSIQLVKPAPSSQTSNFAASVENHFVAPWARGHGIAKMLLLAAEGNAKSLGLSLLKLSVRANLESAIKLYETSGYKKWGILDKYEIAEGEFIAGYFYSKDL